MQQSRWRNDAWGLLVALVLIAVPAVRGGDPDPQLKKAADLFQQQEYVAAQEAMKEVDRDKLTEEEQAEYDRLKAALPTAITQSQAAVADLARAELALAEGRWDEADRLYESVLNNAYARVEVRSKAATGRQTVVEKKRLAEAAQPTGVVQAPPTTTAPAPPPPPPSPPPSLRLTPIDEMKLRDQILWGRAKAHAQELAKAAREAVERKALAEARQMAEAGLHAIESAKHHAPAPEYEAERAAAERLRQEIDDAARAQTAAEAQQEREETTRRVAARRALLEQQRREKIEQLFNTAAELRKQHKFAETAEVYRQILYIDPTNEKARYLLEFAEDYASLSHEQEWEHDLQRQTRKAVINAQEALVPWDYEVLYPKNWLELTARRGAAGVAGAFEDGELNARLNDILPEFQFQDAPLEVVLDHLQGIQKVNLAVDWEDLKAQGIERDKTITLQLRGLPFKTVLKEVLAQAGGEVRLAYAAGDGLLRVATKDKLDKDKYVLVYDIRDLLVHIPVFTNAARMDPAQAMSQPGLGGQGGGGGAQLFQSSSQQQPLESFGQVNQVDVVGRLTEVIRQTVELDSWQDTGGDGSLRELNGQLIIYNTSDAHARIRGLLQQLREQRALQIALEARFLNVTSNFLEQFGVDLDFVFNAGSAGYDPAYGGGGVAMTDPFTGAAVLMPRQYSRIGVLPNPPGFGTGLNNFPVQQPYNQPGLVPSGTGLGPHFSDMTPIGAQQNSLTYVDPSQFGTGVPGSFGRRAGQPALNIAGSFLDNLQVDFLIRATQANAKSSVVQAPRLVMFNGQRANISVGRSRTYVSSITPQVAEGAVAVQPVTSTASSGTVLDVQGTISADRRYVTVTVQTTQTDEPTFERFEVQRAAGNSPGLFILLPEQAFATVNTTVSIPDGGTVLLGGLKQVGEVELEAGVPILSKIPVLKRAFSNRTIVKDTRTLLMLMKAKIIIQREAEEEAFPTFGTATGGV